MTTGKAASLGYRPFSDNHDPSFIRAMQSAYAEGYDTAQASLELNLKELSKALRDAISTYGPKPEILVTGERQEAWTSALERYGIQ